MTEKEKEIIDRINKSYDYNTQYVEASAYDWNCIVDLIDKQQKEIEELNKALMKSTLKIEGLKIEAVYNNDYISKDKIRNLLEEYDGTGYYEVEKVLEELLEGDK